MSFARCNVCDEVGDNPYVQPSCKRDDCPQGKGSLFMKFPVEKTTAFGIRNGTTKSGESGEK